MAALPASAFQPAVLLRTGTLPAQTSAHPAFRGLFYSLAVEKKRGMQGRAKRVASLVFMRLFIFSVTSVWCLMDVEWEFNTVIK